MRNPGFDGLIAIVNSYNPSGIDMITRAYEFAEEKHKNQIRQSGEPYINHPIAVSCKLAEMKADTDTICAALLHDTIEDTNTTKEEIKDLFNEDIAELVDGVTKLSDSDFSTVEERRNASLRKIFNGMTHDVRIIIIKLADRYHNMHTLQYTSSEKQKRIAKETMDIYVPLANRIGAYDIKSDLEDCAFKYLLPEEYERIKEKRSTLKDEKEVYLGQMLNKIHRILVDKNITNTIGARVLNIYKIYKRLEQTPDMDEIQDLFALRILVNSIDDCFLALGTVHSLYPSIGPSFRDYINMPKVNFYRSLHTTLFGDDTLVQAQIRTYDMDKIALFGLTAYWDINKGQARDVMQEQIKKSYSGKLIEELLDIDELNESNKDYIEQVKKEILSDRIFVFTTDGKLIELPKGATAIDLAYMMETPIRNNISKVIINGMALPPETVLQDKNIVRIITEPDAIPKEEWESVAVTSNAKKKIMEYFKTKNT